MKYYFTYGSNETQPFIGGWTVVNASNYNEAIDKFNAVQNLIDILDRNFGYTDDEPAHVVADRLIAAGYRKQSDTVKEFDLLKKALDIKEQLNEKLREEIADLNNQLENAVQLPCLINVSSKYAVIVDRDKNGQLYKTHSYPKQAAEARLKELEGNNGK